MSKFCEYCKVDIVDDSPNCPLCGKCIDDHCEKKNKFYPKYKLVADKREPIIKILEKLSLLFVALSIAVNLFTDKTISWSLYVIISFVLLNFVILRPIKKKFTLAQVLSVVAFWLTCFMLFLELYTSTWGWGVMYAIPFTWLGLAVLSGIMTMVHGYVNFEMFKPMFMLTFLSAISLILVLCFNCEVVWPTLVALLVSASEIILMFMFRFKRSVRSLKKDFGI